MRNQFGRVLITGGAGFIGSELVHQIGREELSLPMYPELTREIIAYVVDRLREAL